MEDICPKCGLPQNLCVCQEIAKESQKIKIRTDKRRFGKLVTIVSGLDESKSADQLCKELKRKLACGGTVRNSEILLQGNHSKKVKAFLLKQGYKEELIDD
ncbi:MAG: translation initiation factor [Candidatus Diapherotrites archaeon]